MDDEDRKDVGVTLGMRIVGLVRVEADVQGEIGMQDVLRAICGATVQLISQGTPASQINMVSAHMASMWEDASKILAQLAEQALQDAGQKEEAS